MNQWHACLGWKLKCYSPRLACLTNYKSLCSFFTAVCRREEKLPPIPSCQITKYQTPVGRSKILGIFLVLCLLPVLSIFFDSFLPTWHLIPPQHFCFVSDFTVMVSVHHQITFQVINRVPSRVACAQWQWSPKKNHRKALGDGTVKSEAYIVCEPRHIHSQYLDCRRKNITKEKKPIKRCQISIRHLVAS